MEDSSSGCVIVISDDEDGVGEEDNEVQMLSMLSSM